MGILTDKPKNQWAKAVKILYLQGKKGASMKDVLLKYYPFFYKFSVRVGDIEANQTNFKINREIVPFTDADGVSGYFTKYTCTNSKIYLKMLFEKLNKKGLVGYSKNRGK
jgi:hypothetical protein